MLSCLELTKYKLYEVSYFNSTLQITLKKNRLHKKQPKKFFY